MMARRGVCEAMRGGDRVHYPQGMIRQIAPGALESDLPCGVSCSLAPLHTTAVNAVAPRASRPCRVYCRTRDDRDIGDVHRPYEIFCLLPEIV